MSGPVRMLVVAVPDWPVVAAGIGPGQPATVLFANRVVAVSPAARAEGVSPGLRRREAQGRCPELVVLDHDPTRDARAFEPVVAALEALTPRIEITEPGRCGFPTRGPSRYFGGDAALVDRARRLAAGVVGERATVGVGIADGPFAATLAALTAGADQLVRTRRTKTSHSCAPVGGVVAPGTNPRFLAPFPLDSLGPTYADLVDVLRRLGLRTLGDFAALPAPHVLGRFGTTGAVAHRLASGLDDRPPDTRPPPPEWAVTAELDPPAERVDTAAFVARSLAGELYDRLAGEGLVCARLAVVAETEHGESHERLWRTELAGGSAGFSAGAIADRVRWQLDGWLNGSARHRPTAGITLLRLVPDEVVPATGRQLGFWGGAGGADERAVRALARLEGLLGPGAVTVPELRGGRGPGERVALVPAGAVDLTGDRSATVSAPWPGRMPDPAPVTVPADPVPAEVMGDDGIPVGVTGRGLATATPAQMRVGTNGYCPWVEVVAWAGPWPAEERWWDHAEGRHRRRARFQVVTADGVARLLVLEGGRWWVEAVYD